MERKAIIYEKLSKGESVETPIDVDDEEEGFLVDFDRKMVHEKRESIETSNQRGNKGQADDDWYHFNLFPHSFDILFIYRTEYTDSRGIKRRCWKSDLEELESQRKQIRTDDQLDSMYCVFLVYHFHYFII